MATVVEGITMVYKLVYKQTTFYNKPVYRPWDYYVK